jgi:hypothetical protein
MHKGATGQFLIKMPSFQAYATISSKRYEKIYQHNFNNFSSRRSIG